MQDADCRLPIFALRKCPTSSVHSRAIAVVSAGYVAELIALPKEVLVTCIVFLMAAIAAWGVRESVAIAGNMTLVEVAGLNIIIIVVGLINDPGSIAQLPASLAPPIGDFSAISGVLAASMIAFFAFDDVVNLVEEAKNPQKIMPWAIGITLFVVTVLYVLVSFVAMQNLTVAEISATSAPVSLLFERLTGLPPFAITLIAIIATMNGVVIILIMAACVCYGLAREERLPAWLGVVSPRSRTPVRATILIAGCVLLQALFTPLGILAETSSKVLLMVFAVINLALVWFKLRGVAAPEGAFTVHIVFPIVGIISCVALLLGAALFGG